MVKSEDLQTWKLELHSTDLIKRNTYKASAGITCLNKQVTEKQINSKKATHNNKLTE